MSKTLDIFRSSAANGYDPNMLSYKLVLQACSAAGDAKQALSTIGEIVADQRRHIQLDCACMESLLASCRCANLNEGTTDGIPLWKAVLMNVENSIIRNDFLPSPFAYSDIIRLCCFGEQPSLLSQYVEHMNGAGLPLTTTNLDEMLILYKKKGINPTSLSKLLKERSTSEINYMKSRWPQGDPSIARNVQKVVDRCLRHNAIVSGDTYASMIMCMHDGGKFKESLALLEMVLGFRDCPVPAVKYLPPPCRLVSLWQRGTANRMNNARIRARTINAFVELHRRYFQEFTSSQSKCVPGDIFSGMLFWKIVCRLNSPEDLFIMAQGIPHMGHTVRRGKIFMVLEKVATACSSQPDKMEFLIRYMHQLGKPMCPSHFPSLIASFGSAEKFEEMTKFLRFLCENDSSSPELFTIALESILSSAPATRSLHVHALEDVMRTHVPNPDQELLTKFAITYAQSDRWDHVLSLVDYMKTVDLPRSLEFYSVVLRSVGRRRAPHKLLEAINEDADAPGSFSWREVTEHFLCRDELSLELTRMLELRHKSNFIQAKSESLAQSNNEEVSTCRVNKGIHQPKAQPAQIDFNVSSVLYTNRLAMSYVFSSLNLITKYR